MTQIQHTALKQKAAMQHTLQDHQKACKSQTQNTSRGPDLLASPFQQRATARPAISALRHTCQNQATSTPETSHLSTSTHQTKPKMSTASTYHQRTRKTPLLPTPPSPVRNFNYSSHYKQYITRPSAFNNRNPAFTRPSPFYNRLHQQPIITRPSPFYNTYPTIPGPANYRYYPQQHIPGPHTAFLTGPYQQTPLLPIPALTGPYQQISGHFQQVYYVPVILLQLLQHYTG